MEPSASLKLYMLLLGSKAPNRNVEQHDYFFAIGPDLAALIPEIKAFWPEAGSSIHVDGWREVNMVDGYRIRVVPKVPAGANAGGKKLFFLNLGGYRPGVLEETHYRLLTVQDDRAIAIQEAKKTAFFQTNSIKGANSHIDEKYGFDVDDIYRVEEILPAGSTDRYSIEISPDSGLPEDEIHLAYLKLDKLHKLSVV